MTEETKPKIAILGGTGKEGPGLAMRWAAAGYPVLIGSRQLEKAQVTAAELRQKLNLDHIEGLENGCAARQADICVLTVVQSAHEQALLSIKDDLQGKILVDATARVDFRDPHPPESPSAARQAQTLLGAGVRVVAAFQNVPSHALKKLDQELETDVLVCADDLDAAQQVIGLAKSAGMRAYYAGNLDNALVVEGLTSLLIAINNHYRTKAASIRVSGIQLGS